MKHLLTTAVVVLFAACNASAQEPNPFIKANVGEWVEYNVETTANNVTLKGKLRMTVSAKDEKTAKLRTALTLDNQENPAFSQDTIVDLSKPFDPTTTTGVPGAAEASLEKKEDDTMEKLTISGKQYDTTVSTMRMSATVNGQDFESEVKVWISKEIPLAALAKMEVRSALAEFKMTYAGTGTAKQ